MPQQPKPPDLDEQGNPVDTQPPDLDEYGYPIETQEPSFAKRAWDWAITPLTRYPAELGKQFADWYTQPTLATSPTGQGGMYDDVAKAMAMTRGFLGGAAEGVGNVISEFTSPLNLATMGAGGAEAAAIKRGLPEIAKAAGWTNRLLSAPFAYTGAQKILSPESTLEQRLMGIPEVAGGAAGLLHTPGGRLARSPENRPMEAPRPALEAPIQGELPFEAPRIRKPPEPVEGQTILPLDYDEPIPPIKPPVSPAVAEPVIKPPPPAEQFMDVTGPKGLEADLTTIEGIQKAYAEGKLDRETALRSMAKIHRKTLVKPKTEPEGVRIEEEGQEVVIDPETGEIIDQKPYPLTTEPVEGTKAPAGVDEVLTLMTTKQVKNIRELQEKLGVSFQKTKELWEAAKERGKLVKGREGFYEAPEIVIGAQKSAGETALPTPFRKQLKEMYYTDEEINKMSTDEAWNIIKTDKKFMEGDWMERYSPEGEGIFIGKEPPPVSTKPPRTVIVKAEEIDYIKQLRRDGYKLVDINKEGDFVFRTPEPSDVEAPGFESKYKGATDEALNQAAERIQNPALRDLIKREGSQMAVSEEGLAGMGIPDSPQARRDLIEIFRGTISGQTPHVAGKELLQNAIDAASALPKGGKVKIIMDEGAQQLVVLDNGPGMNRQQVETDYLDLTGSGKRGGDIKTIGELGVGKIAYLTKGEKFAFQTVSRDPDGRLMKHSFVATPEEVLDMKVRIVSEEVPEGTPTGTATRLFTNKDEDWWGLRDFVKSLEKHSQLSVPVEIVEQNNGVNANKYGTPTQPVYVAPKTSAVGQFSSTAKRLLGETTSPGAKLKVSVPWDAIEAETNEIDAILVSRGMFQGVHRLTIGPFKVRVPNKIVVEIEPTVKGTDERYPLTTPTRENMKWSTTHKVQEIIQTKLIDEAAKQRNRELETTFRQIVPKPGQKFAMVDPTERFTVEELDTIANNPEMVAIARTADNYIRDMEKELARLIPNKKVYSTGFILEESTRGTNVRNPNNHDEFSILLNPLGILSDNIDPRKAADGLVHALVHEFTHILERSEGARFTSALYQVYSNLDLRKQYNVRTRFEKILSQRGAPGEFGIEVQDLLRKGEAAFRRPGRERMALIAEEGSQLPAPTGQKGLTPDSESTGNRTLRDFPIGKMIIVDSATPPQALKRIINEGFKFVGETKDGKMRFEKVSEPKAGPILEEEVGTQRPTNRAIRGQLGAIQDAQKSSAVMEAFNFPRGVMASWDFSAPLRQGLPLIHKQEFWRALGPMFKSWATEEGFQAAQARISERPLFKKRVDPMTGKEIPSFADDAGLKLTDLLDLSKREEAIMSTWAEKVPLVRRSNRAYTAFLNNLRADTFESLIKDAGILGGNPQKNLPLARAIADFVNTATGRGKLAVDIPQGMQKAFGGKKELSLESAAAQLNTVLFAPRLIASRIRMLNPATYMMAPPQVRKEYLKSLFALTGFGSTILGLAKMAGAEVSMDPTNSDFMKAKIGNVRVDPWAGFQQYAVLFSRMVSGKVTSSTSGKEYDLWNKRGPYDPTHEDVLKRFVRGKTNPVISFGWGIADAQREMSGKPMQFATRNPFENSITQRFIPIFVQDVYQIAKESPDLLPLVVPAMFGMGIQSYENPR